MSSSTRNGIEPNALDTASLEIALLRASGVPARYQFGTIEVSTQQLQNWVGGASAPEAAQQLIAQGGIANRGLIEGGRFAKVRMEHVWVQAYVNWAPGRGNRNASAAQHVNPNGQLNAWVPLDATALLNAASQGPPLTSPKAGCKTGRRKILCLGNVGSSRGNFFPASSRMVDC